jgi:hypothetical protein
MGILNCWLAAELLLVRMKEDFLRSLESINAQELSTNRIWLIANCQVLIASSAKPSGGFSENVTPGQQNNSLKLARR